MKDPAEVLDDLEAELAALEDAAESGAVLVEGLRDRAALEELGVSGRVEILNRGVPILQLCEQLAGLHASVVVLVDWDAKGDELARTLAAGLRRGGLEVDLKIREGLRRITRGAVHAVEELPSFHRRVSAAVASKGPSVRSATDWKARKEVSLARRAIRKQRGAPRGRRP